MGNNEHGILLATVVEALYDSVLDDAQWRGISGLIAQAFSASSVVIKTYGAHGRIALESVTDNLRITGREQSWADYWHDNDLWVARSSTVPRGEVFTSEALMPDAEFERTGFYQDWLRQIGIYHMVGVLFSLGNSETGVLGVHRARDAGEFGAADSRQLYELLPHVRRALLLREKLHSATRTQYTVLDAIERLNLGVLVVDATRHILHANACATRLIGTCPQIRIKGNILSLAESSLNQTLSRLVSDATSLAAGVLRRPDAVIEVQRPNRLPITLLVAPWRPTWGGTEIKAPASIVFLRDPEAIETTGPQCLRQMFGLTPTESVVATAIGRGHSPEQIALDSGVSIGTVRTHLKSILAKTGTRRLAALAALVAGGIIGMDLP